MQCVYTHACVYSVCTRACVCGVYLGICVCAHIYVYNVYTHTLKHVYMVCAPVHTCVYMCVHIHLSMFMWCVSAHVSACAYVCVVYMYTGMCVQVACDRVSFWGWGCGGGRGGCTAGRAAGKGCRRGKLRQLQANKCPCQGLAAVDCGGQGGTAGRKSGSDPGQGALLPPPVLTHSPTPAREGRAAKLLEIGQLLRQRFWPMPKD